MGLKVWVSSIIFCREKNKSKLFLFNKKTNFVTTNRCSHFIQYNDNKSLLQLPDETKKNGPNIEMIPYFRDKFLSRMENFVRPSWKKKTENNSKDSIEEEITNDLTHYLLLI